MNNDNRYILEPYKSGGSNRYVCPSCGKRKCFTRYIDLETGEYVADECGKCNHEASCGYHCPPRQFYHDHPALRPHANSQPEYIRGKPLLRLSPPAVRPHLPSGQSSAQSEFFDLTWAEKAARRTSTFRQWMERLPIAPDTLSRVLDIYYVGATAADVRTAGTSHGPAVVFWLIDEQMRVHDAKLMAYRPDGHRVADWCDWMRSVCQRTHCGPQLDRTDKVLFGLHLLPRFPQKPVAIVESEKTALICACRYPDIVWLATGGCANLQADKLKPLTQRYVLVFPDSGEYDKWNAAIKASGCRNYQVMDFMEQFLPNTDIADFILGEARLKQTEAAPPLQESAPPLQDSAPQPVTAPPQQAAAVQPVTAAAPLPLQESAPPLLPFPPPQDDCPF